jgi:hypothetical protein
MAHTIHTVTFNQHTYGAHFVDSAQLPELPSGRLRIVIAADESGSMCGKAPVKNRNASSTSETATFIQLQQQCMKALLSILPDEASLSLIGFSAATRSLASGSVLGGLEDLTSLRNRAINALSSLTPDAQTNTWAAIKCGLDQADELTFMILCTDGDPCSPVEGELKSLLAHPNLPRFRLLLVAITNDRMNLSLMHELAAATQGLLVYVSDPSMAATTVINAGLLLKKLHAGVVPRSSLEHAILPEGLEYGSAFMQKGRHQALAYVDRFPPGASVVPASTPDVEAKVLFEYVRATVSSDLMAMYRSAKSFGPHGSAPSSLESWRPWLTRSIPYAKS